MRINNIWVNNFKSLVDFNIELPKFACLIGLNGSGKSTLLQFIDFLGQQVRGDLDEWLKERQWKRSDLNSSLLKNKRVIDFQIKLLSDTGEVTWKATYNPSLGYCTQEEIRTPKASLKVEGGRYNIHSHVEDEIKIDTIDFDYEGSVLSRLKLELLPDSIKEFKTYFDSVNSLDLLSPDHLRKKNRESAGRLGIGGQNLSAFLHEMSDEERGQLTEELKTIYPSLQKLTIKSLKSGWKQLEAVELFQECASDGQPKMTTRARHLNDGLLRLIAVLAAIFSKNQFVLFDEIENGISPELIEFAIEKLGGASQQIVVTTHSPMILNYLEDETAKTGVIYLYKNACGFTRSIKFFDIPSLSKKLDFMGPGEAFVDTDLIGLAEEINSMSEGS